jgi:hypothetical protein
MDMQPAPRDLHIYVRAPGGILKTGRKGLIIIGYCLIGVGTEKRGVSVERSGTGKIEKDTPPRAVL